MHTCRCMHEFSFLSSFCLTVEVRKAYGIDCIPPELITLPGIDDVLLPVLNQACDTEVVPEEWKVSAIIPIFKREMPRCVGTIEALHSCHLLPSCTIEYRQITYSLMLE